MMGGCGGSNHERNELAVGMDIGPARPVTTILGLGSLFTYLLGPSSIHPSQLC
jgi:hypothetical protein